MGSEMCIRDSFDGEALIGLTTSGTWGHTVGKSLAFAYVQPEFATAGSKFEVQLLGRRRAATVLAEAAYDPKNEKPRM